MTKRSKPAPRSRDAAKRETREALIDAGMSLFGEQGLDGPSLEAICERAGYTRGAFYVHFRDRDDFLVAVMERVGVAFLDAIMGGQDLGESIRRFVDAIRSGTYPLTREGGVRPHQLLEACARSPLIRDRYVALVVDSLRRLRAQVGAGQSRGVVRADMDAGQVATILMATVIGAQTLIELRVPIDPGHMAAAMVTLLGR